MTPFLKCCPILLICLALNGFTLSEASAGYKISDGDRSIEIYGRIQPRYEWKEVDNPADEKEHTGHDFYIRRTRIGVKVKYNDAISGKLEYKLDNYLQESKDPETKLENAFVSFDYFDAKCLVEFAARYQSYTPDDDFTEPDQKQTTIGVNYYIKKHDVKVQGTYNFNEEDDDHNYDPGDNFVLQLQFAW